MNTKMAAFVSDNRKFYCIQLYVMDKVVNRVFDVIFVYVCTFQFYSCFVQHVEGLQ